MAGEERFLASGHYGSDTTSERLKEGWSPGGGYPESYLDGTMDQESSINFEALIDETPMDANLKDIQEKRDDPNKNLTEMFKMFRQSSWWNSRVLRKKRVYRPIGPADTSDLGSVLSTALSNDNRSPHSEMGVFPLNLVDPGNHTFSEDLKNVVSSIKDTASLAPQVASIVEDMRKICQDDEALSAMCIYISVCSKWDHPPPEMEEQIARRPWGKRGEDAMKTYYKFLANTPTLLSPVVAVELKEKLIAEHDNHIKKSGLEMVGPKTKLFDKMPNTPHRRPSVRSRNRPQKNQENLSSSNAHKEGEGQLKRARPEQTSPRRAHTPPAKSGSRSPGAKRPRSAESKQKPGDLDEGDKTTIQQNLLPNDQSSGPTDTTRKNYKPHIELFAEQAAELSLKKALNEKDKRPTKPEDAKGKEAKPQKNRKKQEARDTPGDKITSSTVFEKLKNHIAEIFLPGTDLKTCGPLKEQLDYTVELYKMLQKPWSPSHIRKNPNVRCESDTEDNTRTCLGGQDKDWPKCFLEMLKDNALFLGRCSLDKTKIKKGDIISWPEFFSAFERPENFLLCFSRAITKSVDKYCIDNQIRDPVFYPNHVEMALIKHARHIRCSKHNRFRNKEAEAWSKILGINQQQIQHKLAIYRAKEVTHVDYQLDTIDVKATRGGPHRARMKAGSLAGAMRGGLATSNMSDNERNRIEFLGERGYFEIPEEIQAMMRRWLIDNGKTLTNQNRFEVDAQTLQDWRQLLKTNHPNYTSSLTDGVIHRYMQVFQERNRAKFPNLTLIDLAWMSKELQGKVTG